MQVNGGNMSKAEIKSRFLALEPDCKVPFLSTLGHNLTVCARSAYDGDLHLDEANKRLRGFNELLHTITGQLLKLVTEDSDRYPDDTFIDILFERGQNDQCETDLARSFEWSFSTN
jgi:hypothetical protein